MPAPETPRVDDRTQLQSPAQAEQTFDRSAERHGDSHPAPSLPPGYELLRELGRGGMGVVYHARQAHLNRTAAVKLLLCGDHCSLADFARFVTEGEAVARVRHPNVVQVYDAGRFQGIPFVAMEYVSGGPLSARMKDGPFMPAAAAHLLEQVARGVAACHAAGILHRDLKPANILLSRVLGQPSTADLTLPLAADEGTVVWEEADGPVPKVADFGLAKQVGTGDGPTVTAAVMGTPSYMAPEQARGDSKAVGPAADVYALGSVLYELLTGRPPFQGPDTLDVLRRVTEDDPLPVRALQPAVPRDLETVCMKCLAKEPGGRYDSADALADDLMRWRAGESITARPAGTVERAARWARRNRPLTLSALAAFATLLLATAVSVRQATDAKDARWQAERSADGERQARAVAQAEVTVARAEGEKARAAEAAATADKATAEAISRFLQDVLHQGSPRGQATAGRTARPDPTVRTALEYAARNIDQRFPNRPDLEAAVRLTIGNTFAHLGEYAAARPHLETALTLFRAARGDAHPDTLAAVRGLGRLHQLAGRRADAEPLFVEALQGYRRHYGDRHPEPLGCLCDLGNLYAEWGRHDAAQPLLEQAVAGLRTVAPGTPVLYKAIGNLGQLYQNRNRPTDAEPLLAEALEQLRALHGPHHPDVLVFALNLGGLYLTLRDDQRAEPLLTAALDGFRATHGPTHTDTLAAASTLGALHAERKEWAAALPLLTEAYRGHRATHGPAHPDTLSSGNNLAMTYVNAGRLSDAVPVLEEQVAGFTAADDRLNAAVKRGLLGRTLYRLNRYPEAEPQLLTAYRELKAFQPRTPPALIGMHVRRTAESIVGLYAEWGKPEVAVEWRAKLAADLPPAREPAPMPRRGER